MTKTRKEWGTIERAAEATGKSQRTIFRWVSNGWLDSEFRRFDRFTRPVRMVCINEARRVAATKGRG